MAIFAFFSFDGFYFYDDYTYIYYAHQIVSGEYQIANTDIFAHRWGLIFPLALSLKIFGTNEWAVCIVPVLASLCSFYILYLFSQHLPPQSRLYALFFFGLDFYTLFFANKIYPDVLLTTLALGSLYFLWHRSNKWYNIAYFVFCNFWAFLCKELIIYLLPFYAFLLIKDLLKKQNYIFWLGATSLSLLLFACYLAIYAYFTGDLLFRFRAIEAGHQLYGQFSYYEKGINALLKRISYEPFLMFIQTSTIITLSGVFAYCLPICKTKTYKLFLLCEDISAFMCLSVLSGLAMFWLMTSSFSRYEPIGLYPRHILFLLPLGACLTAIALTSRKASFVVSVILLFSAYWSWQSGTTKLAVLYVLLAIWAILQTFDFPKVPKIFWQSSLMLILLLHPFYTVLKPTETGYWAEKEIFEKHIIKIQEPCVIYTDGKLLTGYRWYLKFKKNDWIQFKDFKELEKDSALSVKKYVLINSYSIAYFRQIGLQFPSFVSEQPKSWHKIAKKGSINLYLIE